MSSHSHDEHQQSAEVEKRPVLLLAEFETPGKCLRAAEKIRDAGFTKWDTHTPFPVHGMDKAMGMSDSKLGWIVMVMAITGFSSAVAMIWYMNVYDYPIIVGGKPPLSIPSMAPVVFELTILFSAFGAVFGMFGLNKIPRHNHPVFVSDRFERASDDRFFISIEVDDPKFDEKKTRAILEAAHATFVEIVEDEVTT